MTSKQQTQESFYELAKKILNYKKTDLKDKDKIKNIKDSYSRLSKIVCDDVESKGILKIDLEQYIKPQGYCEVLAYVIALLDNLKKSQLRKFFNEIKSLEYDLKGNADINKIKIRVISLIPKLAYSKGRGLLDDHFFTFMKILLTKLRNDMNEQNAQEVFGTFVSILEAILAYHTFYFKEA